MPESITAPAPAPEIKATTPTPVAPEKAKESTPQPKVEPQTPVNPKSFIEDIDKAAAETKAKKEEAKKPIEPEKPAEEKKEGEQPKAEAGKEGDKKPKSHTAILAEAHEKLKKEYAALREQVSKSKPADDPDKPILAKRVSELESRNKELEETVRYANYELSDEYKKEYVARYDEVAGEATARAMQLKIPNADGTSRNLTKEEFWDIVGIGDENDALEAAVELFGEGSAKANAVIERRNEILREFQRGQKAKEEFKSKAAERNKAESEKTAAQRAQEAAHAKETSETFVRMNREREESRPEFNKADDGDEQGENILKLGSALGDLAFGTLSPEQVEHLPESVRSVLVNGELPPQERVKLHSAMRSAMRERPFIALKLNRAQARIAELEKSLSEYEESKPTNGNRNIRKSPSENGRASINQMIDQAAASSRGRR